MERDPDAGKRIVAESLPQKRPREDDSDWLRELNALDAKFFRSKRVNLQIPIIDPVTLDRALKMLEEEIPALRADLRRVQDRRAKSLMAKAVLNRWNGIMGRWAGIKYR